MPIGYWTVISSIGTVVGVLRSVRPSSFRVSPHARLGAGALDSVRPLAHRALPHARLGSGVLLTGLALAAAGAVTHSSLLIAPFAATAALKHAAPHSPLARPRNVIGGYVVGALVGLAFGLLVGGGTVAMAGAAALAAVVMLTLDVEHPPAVAMAVVALQTPTPWAMQVAAAGAVVITLTTVVLAPALHQRAYPARA